MIIHNLIILFFFLFSSSQKCQEVHWKSGHKTNCRINSTSSLAGRKSSAIALVPARGTSKFIKQPEKVIVGLFFFFSLLFLLYTINDVWIISYFSTMEKLITHTLLFQILFPYDEFLRFFNWEKPGFRPCGLLNCGNRCADTMFRL